MRTSDVSKNSFSNTGVDLLSSRGSIFQNVVRNECEQSSSLC